MQKKFSLIVIGIMMLIFSGCSDAKKISQATNKEQVEEIEKPTPDGRGLTRNHIHTVVRTPNGNDYGKDLLQEHLDKHHR